MERTRKREADEDQILLFADRRRRDGRRARNGARRDAGEQPQGAARGAPPGRVRSGVRDRRAAAAAAEAATAGAPPMPPAAAPATACRREVAELKKELEGMRRAITRTAYAPRSGPAFRRTSPRPTPTLTRGDIARTGPGDRASRRAMTRALPTRDAAAPRCRGFQRALVEETRQPLHGRTDAGPRHCAAAYRGSGRSSRRR